MKHRYVSCCLPACLMALQAAADPFTFSPYTFSPYTFTLGADLRYFDYEEFGADGQSLDHETGFIPGIRLAGDTFALGLNHTVEFGLLAGTADYDGQTQSGQAHRTRTDETIYRLLYRVAWQPSAADGSLYARVFWQRWDRDIRPAGGVSGLFERYQWWTLEAGLRATLWQQSNQSLAFELGVLHTGHGTIQIDLSNDGFGSPVLDLGDAPGAAVSLDYAIEAAGGNRMNFGLDYLRSRFDRSDSRRISNGIDTIVVAEPASISNHITLTVDYTILF